MIAIDIETTGLQLHKDSITLIGVYDGVRYKSFDTVEDFDKAIASDYPNETFTFHNGSFDISFLVAAGSRTDLVGRYETDSQILAHVCSTKVPTVYLEKYEERRREANKLLPKGFSHRQASGLSLKVLAPYFLKVPAFWESVTNHADKEYNKKDCIYTWELTRLLKSRMTAEELDFVSKRMMPWTKLLLVATLRGVELNEKVMQQVEREYSQKSVDLSLKLDEQWADAHRAYYELQVASLREKYAEMADKAKAKAKDPSKAEARYQALLDAAIAKVPAKLNYASPAQLSWLLKDFLKLDISVDDPMAEEDAESTGKAVLKKLAIKNDGIKTFLDWREANKVLTAFLPSYKELSHSGVIHPRFKTTGTRTGRTSSSDPNFQQIPSKLYKLFKPRDGYSFVGADLGSIEAVLIALYSEDVVLFDLVNQNLSIHDENAKLFFGLDCDTKDVKALFPKERQAAKTVGFAVFYGAGWRRIQVALGSAGIHISDGRAREILDAMKERYRAVFEFHKEITSVFERGETVYNLFGRPLQVTKDDAYMKGFNTLIQSSASDLNLRAAETATKELAEHGCHLLAVIHDFILLEAPDDKAELAQKVLTDKMTSFKLKNSLGQLKLTTDSFRGKQWQK